MVVVAHGDVDLYCESHGMTIGERYSGKLEDYAGNGVILVTGNCADLNDYYYTKYRLRMRGIELVSTHWHDKSVEDFVAYMAQKRRVKKGGRVMFGLRSEAEMVVVQKIFELRDAGKTMRDIARDPGVKYPDGREIPVSTIQVILRNRERYE